MLVRGYFNLDYYYPFEIMYKKLEKWKKAQIVNQNLKEKENTKREHTKDLISKIDEKRQKESIEISQDLSYENLNSEVESDGDEVSKDQKEKLGYNNDQEVKESAEKQKQDDIPKDNSLSESALKNVDRTNNFIDSNTEDIQVEEMAINQEVNIDSVIDRNKPRKKYKLPSSDLLVNPVNVSDNLSRDELVDRANYLTQSLATYGVVGHVVNVHPGPIITLFEVDGIIISLKIYFKASAKD